MFTARKHADTTALERQNRRIQRLKSEGVTRTTLFVHDDCRHVLDGLRPFLVDPRRATGLATVLDDLKSADKPTNVAQVKQLSPFRYPGGKTWLVPRVRSWLQASRKRPDVFVEPFAGGAMAGLTAAAEGLAYSVVLSELDADVAAVWTTIFDGAEKDVTWLCDRILEFDVTLKNVQATLSNESKVGREKAFKTIVKNRMQRGGIMAAGAGLVKEGEAGRGLRSRWYPETLGQRIRTLRELRNKISFQKCDAFQTIEQFANNPNAFFFIDPPYTAGGKKAGSRLYTHSEVDHENLFHTMAAVRGCVMFSYDDAPEVRSLALKYKFEIEKVPMKNTHHSVMSELLIFKP
jgi:DNA adenine methylase